MKVKDYTIYSTLSITKDSKLEDAVALLKDHFLEFIPIVDESYHVKNIVSKNNLYNHMLDHELSFGSMDELIKDKFVMIKEEDKIETVFPMIDQHLVVVDEEERFKGFIQKYKIIKDYFHSQQYLVNEFNAILDSTYNGIIAINKNEDIIVYNHSAERILGAKAQNTVGNAVRNILSNTRLPEVLKTGQIELGKKEVFNNRTLVINRTPIIKDAEIVGAVAIFQDITDLKRVTEALENEKNASEILRTIIDKAYEGIIVVNEKGYITMINEPYAKFLGGNKKDIIGRHATEIIDTTRLHIVVKTGKEEIGELQKVRGKHIVVMRTPIYKKGKVVGAIGKIMFKDIQEVNVLASKINQIEHELEYYKDALKQVSGTKYNFDNIIGVSNKLKETKYLAEKATHTNSNVLIRGESGTGKELFAHAIHAASNRAMGPFIKVNCAAIPAELLESELFGYEEGAFTGAKRGGKIGKFELANGGSIFLDEIGDMPQSMQAKLLRVLQEKEVERVGGTKNIPLDVRIIAATNRNLEEMVEKGEFREDLYYRLNVMSIYIPSLRERIDDLEPMIKYLLKKISAQVGNYVTKISKEAINYLKNYDWPGNVRELENVLERAINLVDYGKEIQMNHLPMHIRKTEVSMKTRGDKDLKSILDEVEKEAILDCLKRVNGNRTKASKILNISRSSLYEKLWKYGIE
ncbi:sigma 54-interacting transcriptional regulator [Crassaminicella profunda]|uniref:sigma 54-interacting transcriptional regulator n=1 Tax=Crassaminicella profunda TaxID=1286698 RepID=UPI001CA70AC6|nr:sigma 54-interacting transcriptional regulator [Crassaminicella profunda]QZY56080.1 sigma 54-interacting transcriptional regulator [Crassaminicella profunda]